MKSWNKFKHIAHALVTPSVKSKICFIHLPKCGGISLKNAIQSNLGLNSYFLNEHFFYLDAAASVRAAKILDIDLYQYRDSIFHYAMNSKAQFVSGHFFLGKTNFDLYSNDWKFITVLRDPVKKWISNFYYDKYNLDPNHVWKIKTSLEEFIETDRAFSYGSDYVKQISLGHSGNKKISESDIALSIDLLKEFSVVGILENMDKFLFDYEKQFSIKLRLLQENKSPVSPTKNSEINDTLLSKIEELCKPNIEVYNYFQSLIFDFPITQ